MRALTNKIGSNTQAEDFDVQSIRRILICRPNSRLGNQLMVTPLLQEIESIFPEAKVDVFVRGFLAPIIYQNYSNINQIIRLPKKPFKELFAYAKVWFSLRKYPYDLVINIDGDSSSGRMATQFVKARFRFFSDEIPELRAKYSDYEHMAKFPVYNFRKYLRDMGVDVEERSVPKLDMKLTPNEFVKGAEVLQNIVKNDKKTICIYTFATGGKCHGAEWWKPMYDRLMDRFGDRFNIVEVLPVENVSQIDFEALSYYSKDLREIAGFVASSSLFLGADCGIMHLVSTVDTPIVSLFSATPINRYQPYNDGSIALNTNETTNDDILNTIGQILKEE